MQIVIQRKVKDAMLEKITLTTKPICETLTSISFAVKRSLNPGEAIVHQGRRVYEVHFLVSGFVKLQHTTADGVNAITEIIAPGHAVNIEATLLDCESDYSAISMTTCSIQSVPREKFCMHCSTDRNLFCSLHRHYAQHTMQFRNRHLAALSGSYAKQFLSHLAPLFCDKEILSGTHPIPLQQREIASILSVTPEHFSTILDRLEKEGMIVRWKRSVYLGPAATKMLIQDTA